MELIRPTLVAMFLGFVLLVILGINGIVQGDWNAVAQEVAPTILIIVFIIFAVGVVIENR